MSNKQALVGNWNYPTAIRFGAGRIRELPDACAELGIKRPLLVTDSGLADMEITKQTLSIAQEAGLPAGIFSDVKANPVGENVTAGVKAYKDGDYDGVIAFGGGSALDAAKAIALMVGQDRPLWDFEDKEDFYTRVNVAGMAPVVAVPTTSGTGSEVGRVSVITDDADHKKKLIFHPNMLPAKVICDPELTVGLPAKLTGAVGMDALSHNLEAFCSPLFHPMADGIALEGIRLVHRSLIQCFEDGSNISARAQMLAASLMGATAFQKGLGAMHAITHPVGARYDTHHGLTIAVVMPYVLKRNREVIGSRITELAEYIELTDCSFDGVLTWILNLREVCGVPHRLSDLGVPKDAAAQLASEAFEDPSAGTNPIALSKDDYQQLIEACLEGQL